MLTLQILSTSHTRNCESTKLLGSVILFIPRSNSKDPKPFNRVCDATLYQMRNMLLYYYRKNLTAATHKKYFEKELEHPIPEEQFAAA